MVRRRHLRVAGEIPVRDVVEVHRGMHRRDRVMITVRRALRKDTRVTDNLLLDRVAARKDPGGIVGSSIVETTGEIDAIIIARIKIERIAVALGAMKVGITVAFIRMMVIVYQGGIARLKDLVETIEETRINFSELWLQQVFTKKNYRVG